MILIIPEIADKWSVFSLFSLILPTMIINLIHHGITYTSLYIFWWSSCSKWINQCWFCLLNSIDGGFFKMINHPFVITWRNFNINIFKFLNLLFGTFVILFLEGPSFLNCILYFIIDWINVLYIKVRYNFVRTFGKDLLISKKIVRIS